MIVTMSKIYIVAHKADRDRLLEALRDLAVVHLKPVDAARAVADAETTAALDRLGRAIQILEGAPLAGEPPAVSPSEAAEEVLRIQRDAAERTGRLNLLHRQTQQLALWGDVQLQQFETLRQAGIDLKFFAVPTRQVARIQAECVQPIAPMTGKRVLVAVIQRGGQPQMPESAEPVPLPARDRPSIRAEARRIDAALKSDAERLATLVHLVVPMREQRAALREQAGWTVATRSALADAHLYALQGWVPEEKVAGLAAALETEGVEAAVRTAPVAADEEPPTLIKYPRWARPMKGLFEVLGTVPGYREFDVAAAFMIALPIFSAIMISDAGYGLLYLVLPVLLYKKMKAAGAELLGQLVLVIGVLSLVWGILTASFFGFNISGWMGLDRPLITVNTLKQNMDFLMRVSFLLAAIHLSAAHLWRAKDNFPNPRFLGEIGWAVFLWGMYGVVKMLLLEDPFTGTAYPYLLIAGGAMAVLFGGWQSRGTWNIIKTLGANLGLGIANFPLSALGTLGDTISYVRLMALGVASTALAVAFNDMAAGLPFPAGVPVLVIGHAMNVALSVVALLAHGVRLNMLEFSNNLGMQWSGYPYNPFSTIRSEEN